MRLRKYLAPAGSLVGLALGAWSLYIAARIGQSVAVFRGTFDPPVADCTDLACLSMLSDEDVGQVFQAWIADHGNRLRFLNVFILDLFSILIMIVGLIIVESRFRRLMYVALGLLGLLLMWQFINRQLIFDTTLIFD